MRCSGTGAKNKRANCFALLSFTVLPALADVPPGLPPAGAAAYREYQGAAPHRAFAIAPGGAWGWVAGEDSADQAEDKAIDACRATSPQKCLLYASDERLVFAAKSWPGAWGPYATAAQARQAASGMLTGQRFPDLAYRSAPGKPLRLSSLRGKVVLLHFWGSWCPPCRKEMPELAKLHSALADQADIVFLPLQVRESDAVARHWAADKALKMPLADSGSTGEDDPLLHLASGGSISDRQIARSFPTTYVLDKHGLVIFSHVGPVHAWHEYAALLRDAARHSGK
jgi:thiol-disulfide isomerase/thioredoxin